MFPVDIHLSRCRISEIRLDGIRLSVNRIVNLEIKIFFHLAVRRTDIILVIREDIFRLRACTEIIGKLHGIR